MNNVQRLSESKYMFTSSLEIGNRSTAQVIGVGEIPLNGKSMPLTCNDEGEEIVYSYRKL